jgi:hypothetical protein
MQQEGLASACRKGIARRILNSREFVYCTAMRSQLSSFSYLEPRLAAEAYIEIKRMFSFWDMCSGPTTNYPIHELEHSYLRMAYPTGELIS